MTKPLKDASWLQVYLGAINALNDTHFDMDAKVFIRHPSIESKQELSIVSSGSMQLNFSFS